MDRRLEALLFGCRGEFDLGLITGDDDFVDLDFFGRLDDEEGVSAIDRFDGELGVEEEHLLSVILIFDVDEDLIGINLEDPDDITHLALDERLGDNFDGVNSSGCDDAVGSANGDGENLLIECNKGHGEPLL